MRYLTVALIGTVALLAACSESGKDADTSATAGAAGGVEQSSLPPNSVEYFNVVVGDRVFFDTDRYDLSPEAQYVLSKQAEWFAANPGVSAVIEGHADERGTREYNLALGARRAESVRSYLVSQGVESTRLRTVSYGKERPVALCSDESCWSQNRRAVTVISSAPAS